MVTKVRRLFLAFLVGFVVGVTSFTFSPRPAGVSYPRLTLESWSPSLAPIAAFWYEEIARRYSDAVVVICHGAVDASGNWVMVKDDKVPLLVRDAILMLRKKYGSRRIVLVVCNPAHVKLSFPGVTYSGADIWVVPDRALSPRSFVSPGSTGNIFEFIEND